MFSHLSIRLLFHVNPFDHYIFEYFLDKLSLLFWNYKLLIFQSFFANCIRHGFFFFKYFLSLLKMAFFFLFFLGGLCNLYHGICQYSMANINSEIYFRVPWLVSVFIRGLSHVWQLFDCSSLFNKLMVQGCVDN